MCGREGKFSVFPCAYQPSLHPLMHGLWKHYQWSFVLVLSFCIVFDFFSFLTAHTLTLTQYFSHTVSLSFDLYSR